MPLFKILPESIKSVVQAAQNKKASDLVILDLRKSSAFTDYFMICSAQNARHVKAVVNAIDRALKQSHVVPSHVEGYKRTEWVLVDCFDFVIHIFTPEKRSFYALDRLWANSERIEIPDENSALPDVS